MVKSTSGMDFQRLNVGDGGSEVKFGFGEYSMCCGDGCVFSSRGPGKGHYYKKIIQ